VDSVLGNINNDKKLKEKYDEMTARKVCETIKISRLESQRVRMRKLSSQIMELLNITILKDL